MTDPIEHGGNLDMAISSYGGARENWCDLSTGINPLAYPFTAPSADSLTRLPDRHDIDRLRKRQPAIIGQAMHQIFLLRLAHRQDSAC